MAPHSSIPIWVLGDFNTVMKKGLDIFSSRPGGGMHTSDPTAFTKLVSELGLRDVWRDKNPMVQCFSCYSASFKCLLRIDMCLGNLDAQSVTGPSDYSPLVWELTCLRLP